MKRKYKEYIDNITGDTKNNPKRFWTLINNRRNSSRIPNELTFKNTCVNEKDRAKTFNEFFASSFASPPSRSSSSPYPLQPVCYESLSSISTTPSEVFTLLSSLSEHRALGPDNIHTYFLRNVASSLSQPLSLLLNRCFSEGVFPTSWKRANITPVHKPGKSKTDVTSYRPISLLSSLSRL